MSKKTIGLALSGGGYRAAGFHLGTLRALNKLGVLPNIDRFSTISGGSITGACYGINDKSYADFEADMVDKLSSKSVIKYVLTSRNFIWLAICLLIIVGFAIYLSFTNWAPVSIPIIILVLFLLIRFQFRLLPISRMIEKAYDVFFYDNKTLSDLRAIPEIAIGSTNLKSGRHFTFSQRKMGDSKLAYSVPPVKFVHENFPIARAVIASSCVPFAFTPITIDTEFYEDADLALSNPVELVDGGVYDNQGIHKLTEKSSSYRTDIVLVSDAGDKLPDYPMHTNTIALLIRTVDIFMQRIKFVQMINNIYQNQKGGEIAYISLGWDLSGCVTGFWNNLKEGNISDALCNAHNLEREWLDDVITFKQQIIDKLNANCLYNGIASAALSQERLKAVRNISTNLTPINKNLLNDMIDHAAALTELQVRLYSPSIIVGH